MKTELTSAEQHSVPNLYSKKYSTVNLKMHVTQAALLIAAELPSLYRTKKGFDIVTEMSVSVTRQLVRQTFTFGFGPIYVVFT
jgi:hypothetical protein